MFPSIGSLMLALALTVFAGPVFAQDLKAVNREMNAYVDELIRTQKEIKRLKDFSPLQKLTAEGLVVLTSPGAAINPHMFKASELKGWVTDKDMENLTDWMNSTPWILYQLTTYVSPLPKRPLIVLDKKPCDSFLPLNEKCPDKRKLGWFDRWIVYPGDYLCDTYGGDGVCGQRAERTLVYFSPRAEGKTVYFGLRQEKGRWVLHSIFSENENGGGGV